jgi:hypothetical protein
MASELQFDISGFGVVLRELDSECAAQAREVWSDYVSPVARPAVDLTVRFEGEPLSGRLLTRELRHAEAGAEAARFVTDEGSVEVDSTGHGTVVVRPGAARMRAFALLNLVLAALAWRLPPLGAAMLHCGAVLIDDAGFVLVGPAGSGKSSFVTHAREGGARPVSDDLNLLVVEADEVKLAGSPFRTRTQPGPGPGRWPLRAVLFPRRGEPAALAPLDHLLVRARLTANLPYVGPRFVEDRRYVEVLERICSVPAFELTFALDPSFVDLLKR